MHDQCIQFAKVLAEPWTENWEASQASLSQAYEQLREIDQNLSETKAPTEPTWVLADDLQFLVHSLEIAARGASNHSPPTGAGPYYEGVARAISDQLYEGDVLSDIVELAMKVGAVTTTTGYGE